MKQGRIILICAAAFIGEMTRGAELNVPLHFGVNQGLMDEYGRLLEGTATSPGALVQILGATQGIYPPSENGAPHQNNPILNEFHIGQGTDPAMGPAGKVSGSVMINRFNATKIFARVFNRPTREDSSFYTDSQIYTNSTAIYGVFMIAATKTDHPIDQSDDDGDHLNNSWEKSAGTDSMNADSDGDGVSDYHELLAETNPLDDSSFLSLVEMIPQAGGHLMVQWDSVSGKSYQLQASSQDLTSPDLVFSSVNGSVMATGVKASTTITNGLSSSMRHFRIKLVP